MMNKKVLAIIFATVLIVAVIVTAAISKNVSKEEPTASVSQQEEGTTAPPELRMEYPDRLLGNVESGYEAEDDTVIITYGNAGMVKRVFASGELLSGETEYTEESTAEIDGNTVTLKGKDGKIYTAAWIENYNSYLIELDPDGEGADAEEMEYYIEATE